MWSQYVVKTSAVGDFVVKLVFVWVAILLAVVSLKRGKVLINVGAWAKLFVLASLTLTAIVHVAQSGTAGVDWSAARPTVAGFLAIVPVALFAFVGFEAPSAASEEMHDPQRDTPTAIARGAGITLLAYLAPVLAIILVTPADRTADAGVMQAIEVSYGVFGPLAGPLLTLTAVAFVYALLTQGSAWMMATDRMQAVAAADGAFFTRRLGEFSERLGTPVRMNLVSGVVSTVFLVLATVLVHGTAAAVFGVVLTQAVSTLLISYVVIVRRWSTCAGPTTRRGPTRCRAAVAGSRCSPGSCTCSSCSARWPPSSRASWRGSWGSTTTSPVSGASAAEASRCSPSGCSSWSSSPHSPAGSWVPGLSRARRASA